ncbi:MAG TPA: type VI secretion system contractile sheath large subunit, partial [Pirellulaceae bacterium]|nr:type VI secretion system contractile sheath large subunit [Pirellulaceae bacterium]
MPGRMDFDFTFGGAKSALSPTRESDDPLRILILGNFSGVRDTTKPRVPLRQRPIVRLDIDNFDAVLRRFSPQVQLGSDASNSLAETVEIQELEDFRPERLCQKLPTLRRLVELRKSLLNPATFEQAAAQLKQQWMVAPTIPDGSFNEPPPPVTSAENDAGTLERILGQATPSPKSPAGGSPFDVQRAIGQMIQPYLVPAADPNQKVYLAALNNALGEQLRTVLHDRSFQSLEATWRSLRGLISKIEDEGQVQIHLLDIASDELLHQVPANDDDLQQWSLYRRLADEPAQVPGTTPWSLIIGDFTITARTNDLTLLGALTAVAQHLRTPVIAAGDSTVLGASSLTAGLDPADWQPLAAESDQYWQALRGSPAAAWVGLVCPRVLLRLPYGQETDEIESFEFEEFVS